MKVITATGLLIAFASPVVAQIGSTCPDLEKETSAITASYQPKLNKIEEEGRELGKQKPEGPEVVLGVDFDIKWNDKKMSFDVPQVTMKNNEIKFDVPQVTMKDGKIVFDTPSVRTENKKVGQYPEFKCDGLKCKTTWSDIITKVPVTIMERQEVITKIPEFKASTTSIVTKIPEFKMGRQEIVLRLPEFTAKNVKAETAKLNEKSQSLTGQASQISKDMKNELAAATSRGFQCQRSIISDHMAKFSEESSKNITQIEALIDYYRKIGVDPTKVTTDTGETINYTALLQEIADASKKALEDMRKSIQELTEKERESINQLTGT